MATISLRVNEEENKLIQAYAAANGIPISVFIRETVLERIEDDLAMDEERIANARAKIDAEETFDHTEVWKMLGV